MTDIAALTDALQQSSRVVAFTGAGISTESGIPDFRSPGGIWTRYDPMDFTFDRFIGSAEVRERSWQMRREFFETMPEPNAAHHALARLDAGERMLGVITQNIDGLHQLAGSTNVVEIHGTARDVMCIGTAPQAGTPAGCGFTQTHQWALARVDAGEADPACPHCGGLLKSATISFGQALDPGVMEQCAAMAAQADLMLAIGSSLQVYPAAGIPVEAKQSGARLAIINNEETPLDDLADIVMVGRAGEILTNAIENMASAAS